MKEKTYGRSVIWDILYKQKIKRAIKEVKERKTIPFDEWYKSIKEIKIKLNKK